MPIRTKPTEEIPFLLDYRPYELPLGFEPVDDINDMISFNFELPTIPPTIEYNIGSLRQDFVDLVIKNLTKETILQISLDYDNKLFTIRERDTNIEPRPMVNFQQKNVEALQYSANKPENVQKQLVVEAELRNAQPAQQTSRVDSIPIILQGGARATFIIKYNKQSLDSYADYSSFSTQITARIQNMFDGKLCTKNIAVQSLAKERFQPKITVV